MEAILHRYSVVSTIVHGQVRTHSHLHKFGLLRYYYCVVSTRQHFVFEKSLRKTRRLLLLEKMDENTTNNKIWRQIIVPPPLLNAPYECRLWRLLAEQALEALDLGIAEKAFVSCREDAYRGLRLVKRLGTTISDRFENSIIIVGQKIRLVTTLIL